MAASRTLAAGPHRLDEVFRTTRDRWRTEQADRSVTGLFEAFDKIGITTCSGRGICSDGRMGIGDPTGYGFAMLLFCAREVG
jgi:hypothetical protein